MARVGSERAGATETPAGTPPPSLDPAGGAPTPSTVPPAPDLLHGGLLYRVMSRFGVEPEDARRAARRGALAGAVLWTPMAIAALVEGHALPGQVKVPFFLDVAAYVRPIVVIPLLLASEAILGASWRETGRLFHRRGLVAECDAAYDALVERITRAVRRTLPELLCLVVAGVLTWRLVTTVLSAPRDAWFAVTRDGVTRLTIAGAWAGFVVHATLFYLTVRWLWLLSLWYRFLLGTARLRLHLLPTHPDKAAGLGFVGRTVSAASPLVFAWSAAMAATVANQILHGGAHLAEFAPVGIVMAVVVVVLFVLPPAVVFLPLLVRTRRLALEDWSHRMGAAPEDGPEPAAKPAATSISVSSLQDVEVAVNAVRGILPVPLSIAHALAPIVALALPAIPLLFLAFPASEIFDQVKRLLF